MNGRLEQSDGTAWMAMYCQNLLELALLLADHDPTYEDIATKFFEHFALIALGAEREGPLDEEDGFYYDVAADRARPRAAARALDRRAAPARRRLDARAARRWRGCPDFMARLEWFTTNRPEAAHVVAHMTSPDHPGWRLLSIVGEERLRRLLAPMLDPEEFLSAHGLRALSRFHEAEPAPRRRSTA